MPQPEFPFRSAVFFERSADDLLQVPKAALDFYAQNIERNSSVYSTLAPSFPEPNINGADDDVTGAWDVVRALENLRGRVADLGCGMAPIARRWTDWGFEYHGLDISWGMLTRAASAKRGKSASFVLGDMVTRGIAPGSVVAVWIWDSLQHVTAALAPYVFKSAFEGLKKGGVLRLRTLERTPGFPEEAMRRSDKVREELFYAPYSRDEIAAFLTTAGFGDVEVKTHKGSVHALATKL